ncbi:hypothetical protein SAMN05444007_10842 [Cribrihabitans marinus]|uniref:Uncharacterized protein n=1 Tax=Cribrihabitans marinus TaxID=1227549 RepID=A0A1H7CBD4_9RHOB|nr:hypothetical protein [Cribrihabitans marinus]GGH35054.1 hypothetical protein GCM10010973_28130 [Cribrihabitans marinus]SEJ87163.1 hypothetical protein SAMN05444007_10842 [Cribrihabitans marinus]
MTETITIPAGERGVLRLFALDMPAQQAKFLREPGAAAQVLGVETLEADQVEVFPVKDLDDLGLAGYLAEGYAIAPEQLDHDALAALTGWVLLLRSRAFGGQETHLDPDPALRLIGTYREAVTDWSAGPLEAGSAAPYSAPPPPPRALRRKARGVGFALFAVVMALIVALLAWWIA